MLHVCDGPEGWGCGVVVMIRNLCQSVLGSIPRAGNDEMLIVSLTLAFRSMFVCADRLAIMQCALAVYRCNPVYRQCP